MKFEKRLILALDITDCERAHTVVESVSEYIDAVKVNWPAVLACGLEIVNSLSRQLPVICDFKIADIPNTSRLIAENAFERGASGIIIHAFSGEDSLRAVKETADSHGGSVFSVVEMSHPGAVETYSGITDRLIDISLKAGIKGFIAPGTRPERIRHIRQRTGRDAVILSPGIGAQGGDGRKAIESGADSIIVGRAIYNSQEPARTAEQIARSLSAGHID